MMAMQVLNTRRAARRLGCSQTWIHKLVAAGKLKAYTYDENGVLVEHTPEDKRQGQGSYFWQIVRSSGSSRPLSANGPKNNDTGCR